MKIVYSDKHAQHDPQTFFVRGVKQRSAEQPERAERLLAAAKSAGHQVLAPQAHGSKPAESVHTPEYLDFLRTIARDWAKLPNTSPEVVPNVHPARYPATYPKALAGRAGWHQVDLACPIGPHTWEAAVAASESAASAADLVLNGEARGLCALPAARPSRLCRHGGRLLLPEQHRHRRPAPAAEASARGRARCRRPSRQRHAGHLLRARRRADRLDPRRSRQLLSLLLGPRPRDAASARVTAST